MMDTILNLGLNDESVEALAQKADDRRFAWDAYRRLVQMFGSVVLGVPDHAFEEKITRIKQEEGVQTDPEISAEGWQKVTGWFKELIKEHTGREFPQDPWEQLRLAVEAVFESWNEARHRLPQRHRHPPQPRHGRQRADDGLRQRWLGPGSGVAFTRNPSTGEGLFGEYLFNAQGEDVVSVPARPSRCTTCRGLPRPGKR